MANEYWETQRFWIIERNHPEYGIELMRGRDGKKIIRDKAVALKAFAMTEQMAGDFRLIECRVIGSGDDDE